MTRQVTERPDTRPDPRSEARGETRPISDAERAEARVAELLDSGSLDVDSTDKFYFDKSSVPEGWSYEWKTHTVFNKENPAYQVELARMGWTIVPATRHAEMMPAGYAGSAIERDGMILMERPKKITDMVKERDTKAARDQVRMGEDKLREAPTNQFERSNKTDSLVKIAKSMEPMEIPEE